MNRVVEGDHYDFFLPPRDAQESFIYNSSQNNKVAAISIPFAPIKSESEFNPGVSSLEKFQIDDDVRRYLDFKVYDFDDPLDSLDSIKNSVSSGDPIVDLTNLSPSPQLNFNYFPDYLEDSTSESPNSTLSHEQDFNHGKALAPQKSTHDIASPSNNFKFQSSIFVDEFGNQQVCDIAVVIDPPHMAKNGHFRSNSDSGREFHYLSVPGISSYQCSARHSVPMRR